MLQLLILRQLICRIGFAIGLIVFGCLSTASLSLPSAPDTEQEEQRELESVEETAGVHSETQKLCASRRCDSTPVTIPTKSPGELFSLYRTWPPPSPKARGPDSLSAPIPHLLS